jgi:hypothetical protein
MNDLEKECCSIDICKYYKWKQKEFLERIRSENGE